MKPKTRRLLKENNALDARLSPESQAVMTDIVCYLRAANIGVCQQELLRRDITEMLLDGEARGESAQSVIGGDYRAFCDEVLSEVPRQSAAARALSLLSTAGACLGILVLIWLAGELIAAAATGESLLRLTVTAGDLISAAGITALASALVELICRHSFDKDFPRGKLWFALLFVLVFLLIAAGVFLRTSLFAVHPAFAAALAAALLLFSHFSE